MTFKTFRAPLLFYLKLHASFQSHQWIQTGVIVRKRSIRKKKWRIFVPFGLEIWLMALNKANLRNLIATNGLVLLLKLDSNRWLISPWWFFVLRYLANWQMPLKHSRAPLLCQALCIIWNPLVKSNLSYSPETLNSGQNERFCCPAPPRNVMDDLEK